MDSAPAVVDGAVYAGSWDEHVYAIDSATGELLWRYPKGEGFSSRAPAEGVAYAAERSFTMPQFEAFTAPAVADGVVFVGSWDEHVYALDASSGKLLWRSPVGYVDSAPTVVEGVVYVGSSYVIIPIAHWGYTQALDAASGKVLWRYRTAGVVSSPRIVQGVLYTGSMDGYIFARSVAGQVLALDAITGRRFWRYKTESPVITTPTVVDGVVYVGTEDGNVYALLSPDVD